MLRNVLACGTITAREKQLQSYKRAFSPHCIHCTNLGCTLNAHSCQNNTKVNNSQVPWGTSLLVHRCSSDRFTSFNRSLVFSYFYFFIHRFFYFFFIFKQKKRPVGLLFLFCFLKMTFIWLAPRVHTSSTYSYSVQTPSSGDSMQ